jgi:RNA polymerase sigma-70 factor (ECF subfamily)
MKAKMDERTLADLAERSRRGDRRSFRRLVESLTRTLIALAYRYTNDWETARDLTQDTWIKVHRSLHGYDPNRPFRSWLYTVHRNTCLSHLRSPTVRRELSTAPEELAALDTKTEAADSDELLERREFMARLSSALKELTESQQKVFAKVDMEQIGQREAAELLGMSFSTLRTTLHFARKRLAGILRLMEETP